jgi:hypothetical protein
MAKNHRIFISFAIEDDHLRDFLVGQAKNDKSPFSFVDMSVKKPWDTDWKTSCRTKIKGCDGVVGIITKNTSAATGQLWELQCAYDEGIPVLLIYGSTDNRPTNLPEPVKGRQILNWTWDNIKNFLGKL